ncbi:exodeoxyribonuclease V subunit gamma [Snodgrassella sp. CFCC 13594]|uniref:exodeoxyribonuclease V subunit gamma n=1 Tax=Snodgrassella sp. CFCC 13594 TaxID=1775559 RepID=UPI0008349903|nr:exodeoxyribonuclease V subunit gamma [Snodgrassella sp. CFCC 13594]
MQIMVQSQGMRRYLNQFLAQQHGIAANLQFGLPAGFAWQLTRQVLPDTPAVNPFQTDVLRWRLLALFNHSDFRQPDLALAHAALSEYLNSSEQAPYHLAGKLADVFDQYLIYRSDWIDAWQRGQLLNLGQDESWQAQLWRYLVQETPAAHRAQQQKALLSALSARVLPERIVVFGITTLAPLYLQLLQAIAQHTEVHIFAVNPSDQYWGHILPAEHLLQHHYDGPIDDNVGHPLLASLGKQGRDFFDALNDMPHVQLEQSIYDQHPRSGSLLARLQHHIQTLRMPQHEPDSFMDGSIQLVSAHSRLRELQILKDQLLQDLARHPKWQPSDIVVLTPHIEHYLPFIDAVFGQSQDGQQSLPFSIADVKISHQQALLQLLAKTLPLMRGRFVIDEVFALLDEPALRARFDLSDADVDTLTAAWTDIGVHWGSDAAMRAQFGGNSAQFTWQQARDRTVLGWLLPQTNAPTSWQGILPWFGELSQNPLLMRGQTLIDTLIQHHQTWQTEADVPTWLHRIRALLHDLADEDNLTGSAMQQLESALADWQAQTTLAHFQDTLSPDVVIEHVQRFLEGTRQAGFLRGGITFCSMVPMRTLPFRCVCLLGLNDGEFPRTTKAAAFDLIAQHPRAGDRARRDDDRYLFLESILSARDKLYLSYVGKDIRKNEALAPSALVFELTDVVATVLGLTPTQFNQRHIIQHPLQPFSRRYFNGYLNSTRADYATALSAPPEEVAPFYNPSIPASLNPVDEEMAPNTIDIQDWLSFWRNPVKHWLRHQLQWQAPFTEASEEADEPFSIIDSADVYSAYLSARRNGTDFALVETELAQAGSLPEGNLGDAATKAYRAAVLSLPTQWFTSMPMPDAPIDLAFGHTQLCGSLNHLYEDGQLLFSGSPLNAPDTIVLLLRHLLLCAANIKGLPHESHHLYPPAPTVLNTIDVDQAHAWLRPWIDYYKLGQTRPLPFFPKTSLATAQQWLKTQQQNATEQDYGEAEVTKARHEYLGSQFNSGQADYDEVRQVFGHDNERPIETPLFWQLLRDLLLPLLRATHTEV